MPHNYSRWAYGAGFVLLGGLIAWAAIPSVPSGYQVIVDAYSTSHYLKPNADGSINVVGGSGSTATISGPLGRQADAASVSTALSTEDTGLVGALTETAPGTDTASSGLNGRLQRIAQRLTTLITGPLPVSQSGTWTVQPGNTANTTPWLVTETPATSGGVSHYSANVTTAGSGAGVGGVAVDASPGQVYDYQIYNGNATVCYIQFFDQTQALTNLGTTVPKRSIGIPANGGANLALPNGWPFATAITIGATTTRAGSTACGSGLDINIGYK